VRSWLSFSAKMGQVLKRDAERAARVQQNVMENNYAIEAEAKLRQRLSFESSVEQLENEMRGEIARALKNSESRVTHLIGKAQQRTYGHRQATVS
jgi:hypothetical protein